MIVRYHLSYYAAKAERDRQPRPNDWLVIPRGPCAFELVALGGTHAPR